MVLKVGTREGEDSVESMGPKEDKATDHDGASRQQNGITLWSGEDISKDKEFTILLAQATHRSGGMVQQMRHVF